MVEVVAGMVIGVIAIPVMVYLSVKLGTFAYLVARRRFEIEHPEKEKDNNG